MVAAEHKEAAVSVVAPSLHAPVHLRETPHVIEAFLDRLLHARR